MQEQLVKETLEKILGYIGTKPNIEVKKLEGSEEDAFEIKIEGEDLNFLIGYHGKALEALQTMLGLILFKKTGKWTRTTVDINEYRDRRTEKLQELAKKFIDKARFFKDAVELPPMAAWERRQIHVFVSEYSDIESESVGEGRDRRIVLKVKN